MSRKWAATESDSEEEIEPQQQPIEISASQDNNDQQKHHYHKNKDNSSHKKMGFMMNIKYGSTEADVRQFLEKENLKIKRVEMVKDKNNEFGRAVIHFADEDSNASFEKFKGLNGHTFSGMEIITKEYEERERKERPVSNRFDKFGGSGAGRGAGREGGDKRGGQFASKSTSRDSRDNFGNSGFPRDGKPQDIRRRDDKFQEKDEKFHNKGPGGDRRPISSSFSRSTDDHHHKIASSSSVVHNEEEQNNKDKEAGEGEKEKDTTPKERKKVVLAPRTLPVDLIGKPLPKSTADIFGGGKPHDEFAYEVIDYLTDSFSCMIVILMIIIRKRRKLLILLVRPLPQQWILPK
jgi:hypothetical protein